MQIEQYIVDIIRHEMELDQQYVWIRSQNRKIPPEYDGLFCVVGIVDFTPISSKSKWVNDQEKQVVYGRASIQIDLMSRSTEARLRRAELLMALNSYYSKNKQDENCFRIFELPRSFTNTSGLQGGSDVNRFTLVAQAMISETKIKDFDYYDTFGADISVEEKDVKTFEVSIDDLNS